MLINHGFQQPESEQFGTLWYGMVQAVRRTNGRFLREGCRSADESQKGLERPPKRPQQTQNHGPAELVRGQLVCRHLRTHFNVLVRFCMQIVCK